MRILLVEDEKRMAQALCQILRLEKYEVDHCAGGYDGLAAIESGIYDIVILDVMLPGINGYEITKRVRHKGIATPILMLTAKAELDDKVTGSTMMAQTFSDSTQGVIALQVGNRSAGTRITLKNTSGNTLISHAPELNFAVVILSSPELVKGETYTIEIGSDTGDFEAS